MDNETMFSLLRDTYNNYEDSFTVKVPAKSLYGQFQPTKEKKMTNTLYEIRHLEKTLYGHKLAVNSQGHWVMEVKGTGEVLAVDKSFVEEVLPHTIGVQYETGKMVYHYFADAGKYQVGEFYILDAPSGRVIVQVTEVDTKSVNATKEFKPLAKLAVE
jgi:FKBP-type peptidyl-prolyl cis-trans isomerase 2